jgi:hypothetical protein
VYVLLLITAEHSLSLSPSYHHHHLFTHTSFCSSVKHINRTCDLSMNHEAYRNHTVHLLIRNSGFSPMNKKDKVLFSDIKLCLLLFIFFITKCKHIILYFLFLISSHLHFYTFLKLDIINNPPPC